GEDVELRLGIRRAVRPRNSLPNSVLTDQNTHPNIFSPVSNAISTNSMYHIFYSPRYFFDYYLIIGWMPGGFGLQLSFALKHMEGFVKDIKCRGATDSNTHEDICKESEYRSTFECLHYSAS
ncbi:hypothetical protein GIB67_025047, partial [Kingdonia uniflora]